ncbi:hypothetical protein K443DRAFT_670899 [Laccaria amethystina LaAM-08-1]|uniref:Uncharacterized protein n=1 Tax=Laccaria amethystina LaAM-08-1 TaxID=1095629 RepID=A0A0C9YIW6_9AGAR|nr:hypothetical protein K443DRAFT_670899 [Laccaria amethystina LaAM-08-1]
MSPSRTTPLTNHSRSFPPHSYKHFIDIAIILDMSMPPQPGPPYSHPFPPAHPGAYQPMYGPLPQVPQPPLRHPGPVMRRPGGMNFALAKKFITNQRVEVRIAANGWVIGTVLGALKFLNSISGMGYNVAYETDGGRVTRGEFPEEDIREVY